MLAKYDADKDGKLSDEERRKARAAEMIKKFDKDGDGKLDEAELAAMPMPRPRPGGPDGWRGKRGPGGPDDSGPEDDPSLPEE
jgi:Ca2+-binding EF-hand superfamily protein